MWLKELNFLKVRLKDLNSFFQYDSKEYSLSLLIKKTRRIELFFADKSPKNWTLFLNTTQRIELFFELRLKELNLFFFFQYDSKNWKFFVIIWLFFWMNLRTDILFLIWLKKLNLFFFFRIRYSKNWTLFIMSSKNWTFFSHMTSMNWTLLQKRLKNCVLSIWFRKTIFWTIWLVELHFFFRKKKEDSTFFELNLFQKYDSKNCNFFSNLGLKEIELFCWVWLQWIEPFFFLLKNMSHRLEPFFLIWLVEWNPSFQYDSKNWTLFFEYDSSNWTLFLHTTQ